MPMYDFKCEKCHAVHEQIVDSAITMVPCRSCIGPAKRQLSAPARFQFPDMATLNKKRQRIRSEPVWRYPDGHAEPVHP